MFASKRSPSKALLLALALLTAAGRASADDPQTRAARERFERGLSHAQAGQMQEAATEFEAAYRLQPHYSVLYNLGHAYLLTERPVQAVEAFTRYLRESGASLSAERRRLVEAALAQARQRIGLLSLQLDPSSAEIELDGAVVADWSGRALQVGVGHHAVIARAEGYRPVVRALKIEAGKTTTLELVLEPEAPTPAAPAPPAAPSSTPPAAQPPEPARAVPPEPRPEPSKTWAYVLGGAGVGAAGAAVTFALLGASEFRAYERERVALDGAASIEDYRARFDGMQERALAVQRYDHLTIGSAVLSAGLLGTAAYLWLGSERRGDALVPTASLSTHALDVGLSGSF